MDDRQRDRTDRQAADRKGLGLGLGPNINPKATGAGGGENESRGPSHPRPQSHLILSLRRLRMITLEQQNLETIQLLKRETKPRRVM